MTIKQHIAKLAPERLIDSKIRTALMKARDESVRQLLHQETERADASGNTLRLRILWNKGTVAEYNFELYEDVPYYVDELRNPPTAILSMDEDTVLLIYDRQLTPLGAWRHAHYDDNLFFRGVTIDAEDGRSVYHIMVLGSIFDTLRTMMGI